MNSAQELALKKSRDYFLSEIYDDPTTYDETDIGECYKLCCWALGEEPKTYKQIVDELEK